MRKYLAFAFFAISSIALAQFRAGGLTSGTGVTRAEVYTTGAITLSVNPDGGMTSGCLSATSAATDCRDPQAAIDAIPKGIFHNVKVFVDAGTYTRTWNISGFNSWALDAGTSSGATAPGITIAGSSSYTTFTPSTGSGTGTATAYTAGSGTTLTVLTDSLQTWPTDGTLKGHMVKTSLSVTTAVFITDNTATTLTLSGALGTVVPASTTYQICDPSTKFVPENDSFPFSIKGNNMNFNMQDVEIQSSSGGAGFLNLYADAQGASTGAGVTLSRVRFVNTIAAAPAITVFGNKAAVTFSQVGIISARSAVLNVSTTSGGGTFTMSGYISGSNSSSAVVTIGSGDITFNGTVIETGSTGANPIQFSAANNQYSNLNLSTTKLICPASSTAAAIFGTGQSGEMPNMFTATVAPTNFSTVGCLIGAALRGQFVWKPLNSGTSVINTTGASGTKVAYALSGGALGYFPADVHTFTQTGTDSEVTLDGVAYTLAQIGSVGIMSLPNGTAALSGANVAGPTVIGQYLKLAKPTLGTCSALLEGATVRAKGATSEGYTKTCTCVSDGAGTPAYKWCSTQYASGAATTTCTGGDATTCP